jgi:hypothetical protein
VLQMKSFARPLRHRRNNFVACAVLDRHSQSQIGFKPRALSPSRRTDSPGPEPGITAVAPAGRLPVISPRNISEVSIKRFATGQFPRRRPVHLITQALQPDRSHNSCCFAPMTDQVRS